MAQALPTPYQPSADELFTSRLYLGCVGTGKTTTLTRDIKTLLDSDEEYQVIDIAPCSDRPRLKDRPGELVPAKSILESDGDLKGELEYAPHLRIGVRDLRAYEAAIDVFEWALSVATESEHPTVVVIEDVPHLDYEGLDEYLAKCRSYEFAVWVADQRAQDHAVDLWGHLGEIVLHSDYSIYPGTPDLNLTSDEKGYVSDGPTRELGENSILTGSPGRWTKRRVAGLGADAHE